MAALRNLLYAAARLLGDFAALKRGRIVRRVIRKRVTSGILGILFKRF